MVELSLQPQRQEVRGGAVGIGRPSVDLSKEVQTISKRDWEKQRAFGGQHQGDITALVWSPNGALLVTAASDKAMVIWDTKTQKRLEKCVTVHVQQSYHQR